jgi:levansucrase
MSIPTLPTPIRANSRRRGAFRFDGSMASIWTRQMVEAINQDIHVTLPLVIHPQEYFDEGTDVWDASPIHNHDESLAEFDGCVVMVALNSTWTKVEDTGRAEG